jgi:RNA polymerase sigma factor (sigma-70 family)
MPLTAIPGQETAAPARRPHHGALSTCTLRHASDDGLVALTRAGSERAFAEIMRRYQRPLQFYCLHLVGAPRAEDAVQQAFMQAFISLRDGARREIALRPWLYRIARNCAIDLLRKQLDHDELDPEFDGMPQTPGVFEQKEELARIVAAIQALPEGQRRALTLRELEGRSYGEISAELGHTDSGVRQLIFRARTALRNLGALVFPLGSARWRLLGSYSSATVADPHQVATAASVSSGSSGTVLQAAASAVAATVTLLAPAAPHERHGLHAPAQPASNVAMVQQLPAASSSSAPATLPAARSHRADNKRRRTIIDVGVPATSMSSEIVPVPVALTPVAPAAQPAASLPVDPPSVLTVADVSVTQESVGTGALGGSGAGPTATLPGDPRGALTGRTTAGGMSAGSTSGDNREPASPVKPSTPAAKPATAPVRGIALSKVATPAPPKAPATPKAAALKAAAPKAPAPTKPASPKKPSAPKAPASAQTASTPKA